MRTITVTKVAIGNPNAYRVSYQDNETRRGSLVKSKLINGGEDSMAAAQALSYAQAAYGPYVIVAPKCVIEHIPENLRLKL